MRKVLIVSGFSGVGKGTVINGLMALDSDIRVSISDTDREKRNLLDRYNYVTPNKFQDNLKNGEHIEFNKYGNHYYATPRKPILEALSDGEGYPMILEIDGNGMRQVCQDIDLKRMRAEIVSVFLVVDAITLENRLRNRGDTKDEIVKRLKIAAEESKQITEYDYVFINHSVEETVNKLLAIIYGQKIDKDEFDAEQFDKEIVALLQLTD